LGQPLLLEVEELAWCLEHLLTERRAPIVAEPAVALGELVGGDAESVASGPLFAEMLLPSQPEPQENEHDLE